MEKMELRVPGKAEQLELAECTMESSLETLMPPHMKSLILVLCVRLMKATLGTFATTMMCIPGELRPTCPVVITLSELPLA